MIFSPDPTGKFSGGSTDYSGGCGDAGSGMRRAHDDQGQGRFWDDEVVFRVWFRDRGLGMLPPIMENQMEKKMENEMETERHKVRSGRPQILF